MQEGQKLINFFLCVQESVKSHNCQMACETLPATPDI